MIIAVFLLSGGELCFGQTATPGSSPANNIKPNQVKMQEKTKSDLAAEKIQTSKEASAISDSISESVEIRESDMRTKTKLEYSDESGPKADKMKGITTTYQAAPERDKELRKTKGSRKMNDTSKIEIKKALETDGSKNKEEKPKQHD